jgi:transcription antitermination factor NusG
MSAHAPDGDCGHDTLCNDVKTPYLSSRGGSPLSLAPGGLLPPEIVEVSYVPGFQLVAGLIPRWYAVFTSPRHEKRTASHLGQLQIESFLPLYKVKHRWKNRSTVTLELPLFPNYLFVRIDAQERLRVLRVPSVLSIVSCGREPVPVPDRYIAGLRDAILTCAIEPHPGLDVGDKVRITSGAMAGLEGVLDRRKNSFRVVLRLDMIGRSVALEVGVEDIERVN